MNMNREQFEDFVEMLLETESLEDILERYDISPQDVLMDLFDCGKITEDYGIDNENGNDWDHS